jgi:hypothetical protein
MYDCGCFFVIAACNGCRLSNEPGAPCPDFGTWESTDSPAPGKTLRKSTKCQGTTSQLTENLPGAPCPDFGTWESTDSPAPGKTLRKSTKCQGTTSQLAEKLNRAVGRGFIPGTNAAISMWPSGPEECLQGNPPGICIFSAACSVVPIRLIKLIGLYRLRKNSLAATVLKGHGFIRAGSAAN